VVAGVSATPEASGYPMQSFYLKLRAITRALKSWSQRRVGNIKEQLLVSQELIRQFDLAQDYRHAAPSAEK
jgi:hypothetical protein